MSDDSLFTRTAELSSNLKQLKAEERMLSAILRSREGCETTADGSLDNDSSTVSECQQSVDEFVRLNELRAEIWETAVELESVFAEFAKSELINLNAQSKAIPGVDLGAVCSAAVQAVVARYVQDSGSLLSKNNNVAHLLVQFSAHLDPGDQGSVRNAKSSSPDVKILRDGDGPRHRGASVNDQEI
ncbi:hypothetical protein [Brevibacterium sp. VCM10]|uniref:hypothetical protein n=1 Tax=Brevibacterium sp. VCM10 TaxID=1381751 RepID=UPI00046F64AE|nr:hypothetical protein [Brevibacterium sp. VCM10]